MTAPQITFQEKREAREAVRTFRRRLGELHDGLQHDHIRLALQALYERSAGVGINVNELTVNENLLLLTRCHQS